MTETSQPPTVIRDLFDHLIHHFNLALFVSAVVYCWLMHNFTVWFYFLALEILYLVLFVGNGPLPRLLTEIKQAMKVPQEWDWTGISSWLLLASSIGWTVWHADSVALDGETISNAYGRWEVAALLWNVAFTIVSFRYLPPTEKLWSKLCIWV